MDRQGGNHVSRTSDRRYLRNRKKIRDQDICWLCGQWIDPSLKAPHPQSWTADHVQPFARTGDNYGELKPAHRFCNTSRGADRKKKTVPHGRNW